MAEIRPLRAWRYNSKLNPQLETLTSPLFDVVSQTQLDQLYQNPENSIHLSVPQGTKQANYAKDTLQRWKLEEIIEQDALPGIYVYYQYFKLPGDNTQHCRKGFIANLRVTDWDERQLLRHENTMSHSVNDRIQVLEATQMNVAPTHGLYTDDSGEIEGFLDQAMLSPIYELEDYQGVRDVFSVIHDVKIIRRIMEIISDKKIILADGHHRYEGSLAYFKKMKEGNPNHTGEEGYNFHLMNFTNTEADDLRILPTHRTVTGLQDFDAESILQKLEEYFTIKPVDNAYDIGDIILGKPYAYGLIIGDQSYKIRLKEGQEKLVKWDFPDQIKELELTVLHYFVIDKVLGISGKHQKDSRHLSFERSIPNCINSVREGDAQMALITQDISIETVKEVCYSGYTLPQKSTYFYPKVICGFLFGSILEEEFHSDFDKAFK